jgi:hypothetical protein
MEATFIFYLMYLINIHESWIIHIVLIIFPMLLNALAPLPLVCESKGALRSGVVALGPHLIDRRILPIDGRNIINLSRYH